MFLIDPLTAPCTWNIIPWKGVSHIDKLTENDYQYNVKTTALIDFLSYCASFIFILHFLIFFLNFVYSLAQYLSCHLSCKKILWLATYLHTRILKICHDIKKGEEILAIMQHPSADTDSVSSIHLPGLFANWNRSSWCSTWIKNSFWNILLHDFMSKKSKLYWPEIL